MKINTMLGVMYGYGINKATSDLIYSDPLDGVDINKEFILISEKKSNLSANLRRLVIRRYEREREK